MTRGRDWKLLAEMANSVMDVISPSFAMVATPQTTELRELMAEMARLKRQISNLQATGRCKSNNRSNRRTRTRSPSLHTSMQPAGKRASQQLEAKSVAGLTQSRLFHATNCASGLKFLIDTGVEVSVVPPSHTHRKTQNVLACKLLATLQFLRMALPRSH